MAHVVQHSVPLNSVCNLFLFARLARFQNEDERSERFVALNLKQKPGFIHPASVPAEKLLQTNSFNKKC
jgi:hypothetical protein